jgi:hypothetical protein
MRDLVRIGPALLAVMLATTTMAACSQSTGGTAAPGTLIPTISTPAIEPRTSMTTSVPSPSSSEVATSSTATRTTAEPSTAESPETAVITVTVTTAVSSKPIPPTDLAGEVYGFVKSVDVADSQITLDKIDWFTGAAAAQACAEDGITSIDNNRCTGYYYRNVNPALRVVTVSPQATIVTLANTVNPVASDLNDVARRIATSGGDSNTYHLVVTDGLVTDLREMYHP